jgi:hypothetical protein
MKTIAEKLFEKIANDAIEYGYQEEALKMDKEAALETSIKSLKILNPPSAVLKAIKGSESMGKIIPATQRAKGFAGRNIQDIISKKKHPITSIFRESLANPMSRWPGWPGWGK